MVTRFLIFVSQFITAVISASGYAGVALLMAMNAACIPVPSEITMPFAGYLVAEGRFNLWWLALVGAAGYSAGANAAYWGGALGGRPFIERYGRYILLSQRDLAWAEGWFTRHGDITVFVAPLLPVVRSFIAVPAGMARMNLVRFNLFTFLGCLPWSLGLAYLGLVFGANWEGSIRPWFQKFDLAIGVLLLAAAAWFFYSRREELRALLQPRR